MRWLPLLLGLGGCELVFPLSDPPQPASDAMPPDGDPPVAMVDEDGDQILDDIDNCPGISNQSQADDDEDDVGNACDPYSNLGGDHVFARFMFATDFGDVSPGDNLQIIDGSVETLANADEVDTTLTYVAPAPLPKSNLERLGLTAEVGFTVQTLGTPALLQVRLDGVNTIDCTVTNDAAILNATDGPKPVGVGTVLQPNMAQRIVVGAHEDRGAFCELDGDATGFGSGRDEVTVTVVIQHMHVRIDYLVIYDNTAPLK